MPRGDKSSYTNKQKRKAEHIEEGYMERGVSRDEAERRAWATVNKETGGGNKSGSGRGVPDNKSASREAVGSAVARRRDVRQRRVPDRRKRPRPRASGARRPASTVLQS